MVYRPAKIEGGGGVELKVEPCQPTWRQHTSATTTSTGKPIPGSSLEHISGSRWPSNYDPGASDRPQVSLFWLVRNGTFSLFFAQPARGDPVLHPPSNRDPGRRPPSHCNPDLH